MEVLYERVILIHFLSNIHKEKKVSYNSNSYIKDYFTKNSISRVIMPKRYK